MLPDPGAATGESASLVDTLRPYFAASGFITGVLVIVAYIAEGQTPNFPSPTQVNFTFSNAELTLLAFRSYAWGLFAISAIPFFALLGRLLRARSADGAWVATLLVVIGVTLYALRAILQDSAAAVAGSTVAPSPTEAAYQVYILTWAANPLQPLGGAIWGLGFILFGVLTRKSGVLPNWLSVVAFVGGVAGWAIFPVLNFDGQFIGYLFTELLLPFTTAIWCFACAVMVLRGGRGFPAGGKPA